MRTNTLVPRELMTTTILRSWYEIYLFILCDVCCSKLSNGSEVFEQASSPRNEPQDDHGAHSPISQIEDMSQAIVLHTPPKPEVDQAAWKDDLKLDLRGLKTNVRETNGVDLVPLVTRNSVYSNDSQSPTVQTPIMPVAINTNHLSPKCTTSSATSSENDRWTGNSQALITQQREKQDNRDNQSYLFLQDVENKNPSHYTSNGDQFVKRRNSFSKPGSNPPPHRTNRNNAQDGSGSHVKPDRNPTVLSQCNIGRYSTYTVNFTAGAGGAEMERERTPSPERKTNKVRSIYFYALDAHQERDPLLV